MMHSCAAKELDLVQCRDISKPENCDVQERADTPLPHPCNLVQNLSAKLLQGNLATQSKFILRWKLIDFIGLQNYCKVGVRDPLGWNERASQFCLFSFCWRKNFGLNGQQWREIAMHKISIVKKLSKLIHMKNGAHLQKFCKHIRTILLA